MTAVGVLGLGAMGGRIARRLSERGHELVVWNRSPERAAGLAELGASVVAEPAEVARRAEVVVTMVSDGAALREVTEGPHGVTAGTGPSTTVIQMSTVGPEDTARLASALAPRAGLLDAPVLGSISEAESGSLTVFVGGARSLVERWTPLLSELGTPLHVGEVGSGTAAKLVANSSLFAVIGALGEALALASALGLSTEAAYAVLARTPLGAQAGRRRPAIEAGEYPSRFALSLARKDADLIGDAAAEGGVDLRLSRAAGSWLADAEEAGTGGRDYSVVLAHIIEHARRTGDR